MNPPDSCSCSPNKNCSYTFMQRNTPAARWNACQSRKALHGLSPCPKPKINANNTIAPNYLNQSKKMRDASRVKMNGRGWRKVNWRRFKLIQRTKQYRKARHRGCQGGTDLTVGEINALPADAPQLPAIPVTCHSQNIQLPPPPPLGYIKYI